MRPRVLSLLRLLALRTGSEVHREQLLDLLWPDAEPRTALRRLQVAVSSLRQALLAAGWPSTEPVRRVGATYRLVLPPGAVVDARALDEALTAEERARVQGRIDDAGTAAREALALYRGDLLPEEGPAEWVVGERDRLRVRTALVARGLAADRAVSGDPTEGITAALRSLELDPYQERPWALLARLHERAGDPTAAAWARHERARLTADLAEGIPSPRPPGDDVPSRRSPHVTMPASPT